MTIAIDKPSRRKRHVQYRRYRNKNKIPGSGNVETTTRPCMCCGHPFKSEGKFNRLCHYCKDTHSYSIA